VFAVDMQGKVLSLPAETFCGCVVTRGVRE